jgi:hypothetical protein
VPNTRYFFSIKNFYQKHSLIASQELSETSESTRAGLPIPTLQTATAPTMHASASPEPALHPLSNSAPSATLAAAPSVAPLVAPSEAEPMYSAPLDSKSFNSAPLDSVPSQSQPAESVPLRAPEPSAPTSSDSTLLHPHSALSSSSNPPLLSTLVPLISSAENSNSANPLDHSVDASKLAKPSNPAEIEPSKFVELPGHAESTKSGFISLPFPPDTAPTPPIPPLWSPYQEEQGQGEGAISSNESSPCPAGIAATAVRERDESGTHTNKWVVVGVVAVVVVTAAMLYARNK